MKKPKIKSTVSPDEKLSFGTWINYIKKQIKILNNEKTYQNSKGAQSAKESI